MESWRERDVTEEAVVEVVAVVLDAGPVPKRLAGLKEPFELFDEVLPLVTGGGFGAEATVLTSFQEEETGALVGLCGSTVPAPLQTCFMSFLAEDRNPNLEVVALFSKRLVRVYSSTRNRETHSLRRREMGDQHSFAAQLR